MMKPICIFALLLTSCAYNHVGELNHPGNSNLFLAAQADGGPAVHLYQINRTKSGIMYFDETRRSMSLPPGNYEVALNCLCPDSNLILDGMDEFKFTIAVDASYTLDCSPERGANHYSLKQ